MLTDEEWADEMWSDGESIALRETGLDDFPETCPWNLDNEVFWFDWLTN